MTGYPTQWAHGAAGVVEFREFHYKVQTTHGDALRNHLRAGTQIRRARTSNGVKAYCSKQYLGKECEGFGGKGVGRFWGVHNCAALPQTAPEMVTGEHSRFVTFARIVRKLAAAQKGYRKLATGSIDLMTERPEQWRALLAAIFAGKVGLASPIHTLEELRVPEREGHCARRAFAQPVQPCAAAS